MTNLTGQHLINGDWVSAEQTFTSLSDGSRGVSFAEGNAEHVNAAAQAAEECFQTLAAMPPSRHAKLLRAIAEEIDASAEAITAYGVAESGLPEARLIGERGRTTGQLRLFADFIETGEHLDRRHDVALPDRAPAPRPNLNLMQRPVGVVVVFGASNFPLAFSTAGGDTASALAAGCPVIVRGHPAHPATGEIMARAIATAVAKEGYPGATFQMIQGSTHQLGQDLVEHPLVSAVGFTGSLRGGRALYDFCVRRPVPIPFFGELGSINPVFVLPSALKARGDDIARNWVGSLTMGAGQFCTNPGLMVVPAGADGDAFCATALSALKDVRPQKMLTAAIAASYDRGTKAVSASTTCALEGGADGRNASPALASVSASDYAANNALSEEIFGPFGLIVRTPDTHSMVSLAKKLEGQLTCTLQMDEDDQSLARELLPILERKAGRILANGFPTGVEVASAMVHGGPYPASTNFGHTSVGTMAIRRWLRPVCYQDMPEYCNVGITPA